MNINEIILPKELVNVYIRKNPNEKNINILKQVAVVRELAKYMITQEYEAYIVPPLSHQSYHTDFIAYIFTDRELKKYLKHQKYMQLQIQFITDF